MGGRFQRLGAVVAVVASVLTIAPVAAQQAKPKPDVTPPPPPILLPPSPRHGPGPGPPPAAARPSIISNPAWAIRPSPDYPELAIANGVTEGRAVLECVVNPDGGLSNCRIIDEIPAGNGFGQATLAAAARARISPRTVDGAPVGARVRFTTRFLMPEAETAPPPPPVLIPVRPTSAKDRVEYLPTIVPVPSAPPRVPEWATPPVVEFPERALSRGIETGRATIQCRVGDEGLPLDCATIHEDPAGAGFGQAVLRALPDARVSPTIPAGTYIRFVINFSTPPEPSPAPASISDASGR